MRVSGTFFGAAALLEVLEWALGALTARLLHDGALRVNEAQARALLCLLEPILALPSGVLLAAVLASFGAFALALAVLSRRGSPMGLRGRRASWQRL